MSDPILDLLAAPPSPPLSVDEDAVYAGGRRRLRRRTMRRTGFGLGAAVAATAVAFAATGGGVGNQTLPAGPSPTGATSTRATSAELFDGTYAVEVIPGAPADQPNVKFYKVDNRKRSLLAGSSADADVVSMGTGTGADGVMLGTAPAGATAFLTILRDASGPGGQQWDQQPLPGTDYQAVALQFEDPKDVDAYVDTIWTDADGEVRDARASRLPSTKLGANDRFFVARESGAMGVFTADGGSTRQLSNGATTTMGYGQRADGGDWSWRSITLLPKGATDVVLTSDAATVVAGPAVTLPTTGDVVMWSDLSSPGEGPAPTVTKVSWTDKAGTRHTDKVN